MKTRNSLVSNSSSASFVILWKHNSFDDSATLDMIMEAMNWDVPNSSILSRQSKLLKHGVIESRFFTGMMNDISDFGIDALSLYTILNLNSENSYTLISTTVEHDG